MPSANNVSVGKPKIGGQIFRAPFGTALPTSAEAQLNEAFKALGYCSDAGVVNSNTADTTDIKAWGGDVVLTVQTGKADTWKFTLIEALNVEVLKAAYGDENVTGTLETGITVNANSKEQAVCSWVIDMVLNGDIAKRVVIPQGKVVSVGDITYKDDTVIGYETTVSATPDANENSHYEYLKG